MYWGKELLNHSETGPSLMTIHIADKVGKWYWVTLMQRCMFFVGGGGERWSYIVELISYR
jgi:hypothetical protein